LYIGAGADISAACAAPLISATLAIEARRRFFILFPEVRRNSKTLTRL
jgi:hypothetical protein